MNTNKKMFVIGGIVLALGLFATVLTVSAMCKQDNKEKATEKHTDTTIHKETEPVENEDLLEEKTDEVQTEQSEAIELKRREEVPVSSAEEIPAEQPVAESTKWYTDRDAIDIAKVLYKECRGVPSVTEQACVAWTILNRVDFNNSTVYEVVRAPRQYAFSESTIVDDGLLQLAYDVLDRWSQEKNGEVNVGRVLPKEYRYFAGRNGRNYFRDGFKGSYNTWDYSLESPYQN